MNGLLRRLTRRRAATADENAPGTPGASEPVDATVISLEEETPLSDEQRELQAREEELRRQRRDLPAGVDAEELQAAAEGSRRGAVRRRVRYLRRVREILLRDLGGFYYEVHRSAGTSHGGHRDILETKAGRLDAIDHELRHLEARRGEQYSGETVVREPGIGGTCPQCGELHASDAGWCAHCGKPLTDRARRRAEQDVDREIAARRDRDAERARAEADRGEAQRADAARAEAERAAPLYGGPATAGDAPTTELPARGDDTGAHSEDAVTHGERGR